MLDDSENVFLPDDSFDFLGDLRLNTSEECNVDYSPFICKSEAILFFLIHSPRPMVIALATIVMLYLYRTLVLYCRSSTFANSWNLTSSGNSLILQLHKGQTGCFTGVQLGYEIKVQLGAWKNEWAQKCNGCMAWRFTIICGIFLGMGM